jgi:hypothetical protein
MAMMITLHETFVYRCLKGMLLLLLSQPPLVCPRISPDFGKSF